LFEVGGYLKITLKTWGTIFFSKICHAIEISPIPSMESIVNVYSMPTMSLCISLTHFVTS
jgi:hypothetical protein